MMLVPELSVSVAESIVAHSMFLVTASKPVSASCRMSHCAWRGTAQQKFNRSFQFVLIVSTHMHDDFEFALGKHANLFVRQGRWTCGNRLVLIRPHGHIRQLHAHVRQ